MIYSSFRLTDAETYITRPKRKQQLQQQLQSIVQHTNTQVFFPLWYGSIFLLSCHIYLGTLYKSYVHVYYNFITKEYREILLLNKRTDGQNAGRIYVSNISTNYTF